MQKRLKIEDFEIIIRRRDMKDFAAYCPQLLYIVKGRSQTDVKAQMERFIENRIAESLLPQDYLFQKNEVEKVENELFANEDALNSAIEKYGSNEVDSESNDFINQEEEESDFSDYFEKGSFDDLNTDDLLNSINI